MKTVAIPVRDDRSDFPDFDRAQLFLDLLQDMGIDFDDQRIADLGAGYGSIAMALARKGAEVIAIDAGGHQIEELHKRAAAEGISLQAIKANLLSDTLPESDADLALLVGVVEYAGMWSDTESVEDLQIRVLQTALSVLRPGGTLVLCTKNRLWPVFALRDVHTRLPLVNILPRPLAEKLTYKATRKPYRLYIHSPKKWQSLLNRAGFANSEVYYPYLSYQFPIGVTKKPMFSDIARIPAPKGPPEIVAATHGRFWQFKAAAMALAHKAGIPLSQSVVIRATK